MNIFKPVYNVFRSIIIIVILLVVVVYAGLYVLLSVPAVQNKINNLVTEEVSGLLGGQLEIERLTVRPFSEVVLSDVVLYSPTGEKCVSIGKVAAGIDIWRLMADRRIVLNYVEISGLDAFLRQVKEDGPLNIGFLIDALSPKEEDKKSANFDLRFRNVVIRKSKASFVREWLPDSAASPLKSRTLNLDNLRLDLSIPTLRNELYCIDIRNMQCDLSYGVKVKRLSAEVIFQKGDGEAKKDMLDIKDFRIDFPNTNLNVASFHMSPGSGSPINAAVNGSLTPSDFAGILPVLETFNSSWDLDIEGVMSADCISFNRLIASNDELNSKMSLSGDMGGFSAKDSLQIDHIEIDTQISSVFVSELTGLIPSLKGKSGAPIRALRDIHLKMEGSLASDGSAVVKGGLTSGIGTIEIDGVARGVKGNKPSLTAGIVANDLDLGKLLSTDAMGKSSFELSADIKRLGKNPEGELELSTQYLYLHGMRIDGIALEVSKNSDLININLESSDENLAVNVDAEGRLKGAESFLNADIIIDRLLPSSFGCKGKYSGAEVSCDLQARINGDNVDNMTGIVAIKDLFIRSENDKTLSLESLTLKVERTESDTVPKARHAGRRAILRSDWVDADIAGVVYPGSILKELKGMVASVTPVLVDGKLSAFPIVSAHNDFEFDINIKGVAEPYDFFSTPVRPLADIPVSGFINACKGTAAVELATPHMQQGKNKLVRNIRFDACLDTFLGMAKMSAGAIMPAKKGDVEMVADILGVNDKVDVDIRVNPTMESSLKGGLAFETTFSRIPSAFHPTGELAVHVDILPSAVAMNETVWTIANGNMDYSGKRISVSNFLVKHADQFVKIDGIASENEDDALKVHLNDIDLDYIFGILNIDYVSFGGMATGEVEGRQLLTKHPQARTNFLHVKGLCYNGALLGDGDLASDYDSKEQKVGIYGVIRDHLTRERRASIDGGIWVTRDSLSFNFDADKINIELMKPFMAAFCSGLSGQASGKCKLYGTFKDIDLTGDLRADTISMKIDFTNTWYHAGGDSVSLRRGIIDIHPLTLYDDYGHSAQLAGWLKHRYFHDPVFNFRLRDANSILCYDTNDKMNPMWYGTIYGSGSAQLNGRPGLIEIDMNMTTEDGSKFYYVISDTENVDQASFLTFTDRRKQRKEAEQSDSVPAYLERFMKRSANVDIGSSNVVLSLKGTVTNSALVTLVMDPRAGDNITARGQGALQMDYNMASNDLRMIGTYVLDEGNYNFTLQDIIIKNFNIKKGSLIKFDGDPMNANLDIAATYRVNTNLTDLDKSFATDKDLNRTNVPVDAILMVDGPMTHPDITFDIELPSLTSDVERKVKSIVSTNDMMSRQIIYLLALNRFYTPEYTAGENGVSGSELSSVASSTISSQLSNILSQMTDKLDVAPSFRSEKGDFTDMEFDLALSSRLLNNRLLINGNFGYRDRSTSNTQFVGDFDIEYLISKNGNLRLKAYNHFNDQNYYLRSALTTQGVGVVFRRDFDRIFRRKPTKVKDSRMINSSDKLEEKADSIGLNQGYEYVIQ